MLKVNEITEDEFKKLCESDETYFQESCVFDADTENLLAFMDLDFSFFNDNEFHYFKISKERHQ